MSGSRLAKEILGPHKWRLLVTYILFSLEMVGLLLRPFFLGESINDLQEGSFRGLILLLSVHAAWMAIGTVRQMYDTRTYTKIYKDVILRFMRARGGGEEVSVLSARSTLAREFTDFLEFDVVYMVEAGYNIFGSMLMLYFYEPSVLTICAAVLLPVLFISRSYGRAMSRITRHRNDELERQVDVISSRDDRLIEDHYSKLRHLQIRLSDLQARNFGIMEITVMIVLGSALLVSHYNTQGEGLWAGDIVGIYSYILKFLSGLDTIPYAVEKIATLRDIIRRLDGEIEKME
jgi:ABC-type multidrug transport system fused ATPase/permease subunit